MTTTKTKRSKNAKGKDPVPPAAEALAIKPIPFEDRRLDEGSPYHLDEFAELSERMLEEAWTGTEIHPNGPDAAARKVPTDYMSQVGQVISLEPDNAYAIIRVAERHAATMYFFQSVIPCVASAASRAIYWGERRREDPGSAPEDVSLQDVMARDRDGDTWVFCGKAICIEVPRRAIDSAPSPSNPPPLGQSQSLPLDRITESPTNPRKVFRGLEELAASIVAHGLIQPITVRPVGDRYELVVGARRFRATKLAGLAEIPAIVRELSDQAVLEIQVIENDQREDVQPLDQAMGYKSLLDLAGYDVASLAKKIGQSETYVYRRLQLTKLIPEFQQILAEEKIYFGHALELSRLTAADQQELVGEGYNKILDFEGHAIPVHVLRDRIRRQFLLELSAAPWKKDDADLLSAAGPCSTCPKRTGFNQSLFPDVEKDTCTDRKCFESKRQAFVQVSIDKARAKHGDSVLEVSGHWHSEVKGRLTKDQYELVSAKEAKALPADQVKPAVVVEGDERLGKTVLIKLKPKTRGGDDTYQAEERRRRQRAKLREAVHGAILDRVLAAVYSPPTMDNWRGFAHLLFRKIGTDAQRAIVKRRGWEEPAKKKGYGFAWFEEAAAAAIEVMDGVELHRFVVECGLAGHVTVGACSGETGVNKELKAAADAAGVDVKAIQAQVKAAAKEKKKPAAKGKKSSTREKAGSKETLRGVTETDLDALEAAESASGGGRCRVCGCTDEDCSQCIEKTGEPCHWVEEDLCSACAAPAKTKRTRKAKVPS